MITTKYNDNITTYKYQKSYDKNQINCEFFKKYIIIDIQKIKLLIGRFQEPIPLHFSLQPNFLVSITPKSTNLIQIKCRDTAGLALPVVI